MFRLRVILLLVGACGLAFLAVGQGTAGNKGLILFSVADGPSLNHHDVLVMGSDGTGLHRLTHTRAFSEQSPAWSPDGRYIVFIRHRAPDFREAPNVMYVMRADGTHHRRIFAIPGGELTAPSWSPNGRWIAFGLHALSFPSGVFAVDTNGRHLHAIVTAAQLGSTKQNAIGARVVTWSPDGKRLAFERDAHDYGVYVVDANGQHLHRLVADGKSPAWSPDGTKIALVKPGTQGPDGVWVMNPDGSQAHRLAGGVCRPNSSGGCTDVISIAPSWSPDGKRIIYVEPIVGFSAALHMMNTDGSHQRQIGRTVSGFDSRPQWQPHA